jgi:hypothetical protein
MFSKMLKRKTYKPGELIKVPMTWGVQFIIARSVSMHWAGVDDLIVPMCRAGVPPTRKTAWKHACVYSSDERRGQVHSPSDPKSKRPGPPDQEDRLRSAWKDRPGKG